MVLPLPGGPITSCPNIAVGVQQAAQPADCAAAAAGQRQYEARRLPARAKLAVYGTTAPVPVIGFVNTAIRRSLDRAISYRQYDCQRAVSTSRTATATPAWLRVWVLA